MNALQLFNACAAGDVVTVNRLLSTGLDINRASVAGYAPLHVATMNHQVAVIRALLARPEIDLFLRSSDTQQTALEIAQHDFHEDAKPEALQCIQLLQQALCIYADWLAPRLEGGKFLATVWEKRFGRVLRTPHPREFELQLFESDSAKEARAFLIVDVETAQFQLGSGMSRKAHRFEIKARVKGEEDATQLHRFEFAAETKQSLAKWQAVFEGRVSKRAMSSISTPSPSNTSVMSAPSSRIMPTPTTPSPNTSITASPGMYHDRRSPWMAPQDHNPAMMGTYDRPPTVDATPWVPPTPPFPPQLDLNDLRSHQPPSGNDPRRVQGAPRHQGGNIMPEYHSFDSGRLSNETLQRQQSNESLLSASSPHPFRSNVPERLNRPANMPQPQVVPPSSLPRTNSLSHSFGPATSSTPMQIPESTQQQQIRTRPIASIMNGTRIPNNGTPEQSMSNNFAGNPPTQAPSTWSPAQAAPAMTAPNLPMPSMLNEQGVSAEEQRNFMMAVMMSLAEMQVSNRNPAFPAAPVAAPPPYYPPSAPTFLDNDAGSRSQDDESTECVICKDAPRCAACIPCGHRTMCMSCAQQVLQSTKRCPVCRQPVRDILRTYG